MFIENYIKVGNVLNPNKLLVFLHGYGGEAENFREIAGIIIEHYLPDALCLLPDAPTPYEGGWGGRQWFSLVSRDQESMHKGVNAVLPVLHSFVKEQLSLYGLDAKSDLILGGFSQGAMLSICYGLQHVVRGVVGYSGRFIPVDLNVKEHCQDFFLYHGNIDAVVPPTCLEDARLHLEALKFRVSAHMEQGLSHTISEKGIKLGGEFIQTVLRDGR